MTKKRKAKIRNYKVSAFLTTVLICVAFVGYYGKKLENNIAYASSDITAQREEINLDMLIGTPLEEAILYIKKASKYYEIPVEVYIGIANAESSLGRNMPTGSYNPMGVKPNGKIKHYSDWEHSVNAWFHLIKEYYFEEGKNSCETIFPKYVGHPDPYWINNCMRYFK